MMADDIDESTSLGGWMEKVKEEKLPAWDAP